MTDTDQKKEPCPQCGCPNGARPVEVSLRNHLASLEGRRIVLEVVRVNSAEIKRALGIR